MHLKKFLKSSAFYEYTYPILLSLIHISPGDYELDQTHGEIVEQIIRPTGLLDPEVEVRPIEGQIDD